MSAIQKQTFIPDTGRGAVRGMKLRRTPNGCESYVPEFHFGRKPHRMTIGRKGVWTQEAARARAKELWRLIDTGINPLAEAECDRHAPTMTDLTEKDTSKAAWPVYGQARQPNIAAQSRSRSCQSWDP
jgi:hypothetical protein